MTARYLAFDFTTLDKLSLAVLVFYRSWVVFSLRGCFPPCSLATAKARYSALSTTSVPTYLRGYHTLFPGFPAEFGYRSQGRIR
jgi:hypothetical protein